MDSKKTLFLVVLLHLVLAAADAYTTWACLSATPSGGFEAYEANPVAALVFRIFGLGTGLLIEYLASVVVLVWYAMSTRSNVFFDTKTKNWFLTLTNILLVYVVYNNFLILRML